MKKITFMAAALLMLACGTVAADQQNATIEASPQDAADIQHVMDAYLHAVTTHDGKAISALFLDHGTAWATVLSDQGFAAVKAKNSSAQKVRTGSYQQYAAFVSSSKSALDPRHTDVHIMSDGAVAAVYFHFDYAVDGKVENRGDETWQLVKTTDGWRIVAIIYSSNPRAA